MQDKSVLDVSVSGTKVEWYCFQDYKMIRVGGIKRKNNV